MRYITRILIPIFTLFLISCTKDPAITPDPISAPVIAAKIQLLIDKTWQLQEVNNLSNCTNSHYVRGASGNTGVNYDPLRFTFKSDSTGTHTDTQGNTFPINWHFLAGDSQRIKITVIAPTPVVYQWNLVSLSENKLIETTAISSGASHMLISATYVPVVPVTVAPPALTRTQMLTEKPWIVHEVYNNALCVNTHYLSGGSGNTGANYSLLRFKFNANGTGTHTDILKGTYTISWQFTSVDERNIKITVNAPIPVIYNWNQFEITPGILYQTSAIGSSNSNSILVSARWVTTTEPPAPVTPAKIQFLIGQTWQVQEVNNLSNCTNSYYVRGAVGNTGTNYDLLRFTFKPDSTGTHTDTQGNTFPISWNFLAGDSQRIKITVLAATPVVYQWNLVELLGNKFIETTAINSGSNHTLVSATYVPVVPVTVPPPALSRTQMLTEKQWRVQEVYNNASCVNTHFLLGGSGNTGANYGPLRFKFNADGTGVHTDTNGNNFTISWLFTSADQRSLKITVNATTPVIYNWNQFEIIPGALYQTSAIGTSNSNSVLVSAKWVTIP